MVAKTLCDLGIMLFNTITLYISKRKDVWIANFVV